MEEDIMTIVRWDPFRDFGFTTPNNTWMPPVDIFQTGEHELVLKAELPDMSKEDIDINIENFVLTVKGEKKVSGGVKVLSRVGLQALLRGRPTGQDVCEVAGYGPVPVSVVDDLLGRGDTFWAAVITRGQAICGVAHFGRRPTAFQRSALEWLYPTCAREGCSTRVVQWDHRADWSRTHITFFDLLDGLCPHDHALKTREGWALVDGVGKRPFVPPGDPRHPRNANAPPKEAA
jgi:hypothetical protein